MDLGRARGAPPGASPMRGRAPPGSPRSIPAARLAEDEGECDMHPAHGGLSERAGPAPPEASGPRRARGDPSRAPPGAASPKRARAEATHEDACEFPRGVRAEPLAGEGNPRLPGLSHRAAGLSRVLRADLPTEGGGHPHRLGAARTVRVNWRRPPLNGSGGSSTTSSQRSRRRWLTEPMPQWRPRSWALVANKYHPALPSVPGVGHTHSDLGAS